VRIRRYQAHAAPPNAPAAVAASPGLAWEAADRRPPALSRRPPARDQDALPPAAAAAAQLPDGWRDGPAPLSVSRRFAPRDEAGVLIPPARPAEGWRDTPPSPAAVNARPARRSDPEAFAPPTAAVSRPEGWQAEGGAGKPARPRGRAADADVPRAAPPQPDGWDAPPRPTIFPPRPVRAADPEVIVSATAAGGRGWEAEPAVRVRRAVPRRESPEPHRFYAVPPQAPAGWWAEGPWVGRWRQAVGDQAAAPPLALAPRGAGRRLPRLTAAPGRLGTLVARPDGLPTLETS
jgi:hypothetical protein